MAKKGFSVGKEALFKKIMPTNQETEDIAPVPEESLSIEEPAATKVDLVEVPKESVQRDVVADEIIVENKEQEVLPELEVKQEIKEIKEERPLVEKQEVVPPPVVEQPEMMITADEMQQKDIVRPMIYGLPEDKQPYIQQQQQQVQQQPIMPPQMMPGQEIPMYPAPGYMQPPYPPMGMPPEQGAYSQMPPQGAGYSQQPYMQGYPPQYYPMVPSPYYHPNAAFATMYYATGQDGQSQPVVLPQMVVDGAKLSLYDMLEDIPPLIATQEELPKEEPPSEPQIEETPAEELVPESRWKVVNVVELLIGDRVAEYMKRDKEICLCDKCQLDVMAIALNKVAPHYITTDNYSRGLMDLYYQERKVDIMVAIFEAIDIVKANPRHEDV